MSDHSDPNADKRLLLLKGFYETVRPGDRILGIIFEFREYTVYLPYILLKRSMALHRENESIQFSLEFGNSIMEILVLTKDDLFMDVLYQFLEAIQNGLVKTVRSLKDVLSISYCELDQEGQKKYLIGAKAPRPESAPAPAEQGEPRPPAEQPAENDQEPPDVEVPAPPDE